MKLWELTRFHADERSKFGYSPATLLVNKGADLFKRQTGEFCVHDGARRLMLKSVEPAV